MDEEGERLVDRRLVKVRAGGRGAGWAIGTRGVLTARHVIAPFLNATVAYCLAVPDPRPGGAGVRLHRGLGGRGTRSDVAGR